jgi:FtsP/CotA-like multicopper oxidase with cupredoxin domain
MISKQSKEIRSFTPDSIKGLRFECVAYFNLTDAEYENKVAVKRMRPLIDGAGKFTIHGRADFHSGKSENPKIGDIEDWFIINTYNGMPHPIHVHLINFQVVRQYDLRIFESKCSLYGMDFYAAAIKHSATSPDPADHYSDIDQLYEEIFVNERVEYTTACKKFDSIAFMPNLQKALAQIYPEDVVDGNKISGLDVLKKCTQEDDEHLQQYGMGCMETGDYYIVNPNGDPHRQSFFGRWKDTAFVEGFKVFQYRIRWAKSEYRQE